MKLKIMRQYQRFLKLNRQQHQHCQSVLHTCFDLMPNPNTHTQKCNWNWGTKNCYQSFAVSHSHLLLLQQCGMFSVLQLLLSITMESLFYKQSLRNSSIKQVLFASSPVSRYQQGNTATPTFHSIQSAESYSGHPSHNGTTEKHKYHYPLISVGESYLQSECGMLISLLCV